MEIEKSKIIEVWNENNNRIVKYTQIVKNKDLNTSENIVAGDLTSLMSKVREQVYKWKDNII